MKYTLLQLTQNILSSLGSDEVNSISDTPESLQVAEMIRTTYYNMLGRYDLPEHNQFFQLTPSNDPTLPVVMYRPEGVNRLEWLKYYDSNPKDSAGQLQFDQFGAFSKHDVNVDLQANSGGWITTSTSTNTIGFGTFTFTVQSGLIIPNLGPATAIVPGTANSISGTVKSYSGTTLVITGTSFTGSGTFSNWTISGIASALTPPGYIEVCLTPIHKFMDWTNSFDLTETNVRQYTLNVPSIVNGEPMKFNFRYKNDRQPFYWTIVQNFYILFDSYDSTQDSTLQASKSLAFGWVMPPFQMVDNFTPNLDDQQFALLLNDAKALAFLELKQQQHPKAEREVLRQLTSLQKFKFTAHRPSPFEELANFGRRIGTGGYALYRQSFRY